MVSYGNPFVRRDIPLMNVRESTTIGSRNHYACHKGNYAMETMLTGARANKRALEEGRWMGDR